MLSGILIADMVDVKKTLFLFSFLLVLSACSFQKDKGRHIEVVKVENSSPQVDPVIQAVKSSSAADLAVILRGRRLEDLKEIYDLNGDPLVLIAARRGSIEVLETIKNRGLDLWQKNKITGESLIQETIVEMNVDKHMSSYLRTELSSDYEVVKSYFAKGDNAGALNYLSNHQISCSDYTRFLLHLRWANIKMAEIEWLYPLLSNEQCRPQFTRQELFDLGFLELDKQLNGKYTGLKVLELIYKTTTLLPTIKAKSFIEIDSATREYVFEFNLAAYAYLVVHSDSPSEFNPLNENVVDEILALSENKELLLKIYTLGSYGGFVANRTSTETEQHLITNFRELLVNKFREKIEDLHKQYQIDKWELYHEERKW